MGWLSILSLYSSSVSQYTTWSCSVYYPTVADFTEEQYRQSVQLLERIQRLERDKHELEFQASRQRGSAPKLPVATAPPQTATLMKLCLRKRSVTGEREGGVIRRWEREVG